MSARSNPQPLARKWSIAEISPDIQDLGPAITPSQSYSDTGLDAALTNLTSSQAGALDTLTSQPFAHVEGNLPSLSDSLPPSPKQACPTLTLPATPSADGEDSTSSGNFTPTALALTPWTPTHLHEVFDRALPPVTLPSIAATDLPPSATVDKLRTTTLMAADKLNPAFCGFSRYFLSTLIDFLLETNVPFTHEALDKAISIISSVLDLGVGSRTGADCEIVHPSDWLRLARHLIAVMLRRALCSEAFNTQLNYELLTDNEWALTTDLSLPNTEREALTILIQQLSKLITPEGLGKSIINYYELTCTNLTLKIDQLKMEAIQALHLELKADPKSTNHVWDATIERITKECYDTADAQKDDLRKVFMSALQAKLADQPAPTPHANCNKLIATHTGAIYNTVSSRIDALLSESIHSHRDKLLQKAYDQARIDVELCYDSIVDKVVADTHQSVLLSKKDKLKAATTEAHNLIRSEFDIWSVIIQALFFFSLTFF